jgi:non-canonical (house-cleaning) NTP pyrophosphatase
MRVTEVDDGTVCPDKTPGTKVEVEKGFKEQPGVVTHTAAEAIARARRLVRKDVRGQAGVILLV